MAQVLGVGGIFFKSPDPKKLSAWYAKCLRMKIEEYGGISFLPQNQPPGALTVWSPFPSATSYFDPSDQPFMFNLVVDDLPEALEQVRQGGAEVIGEIAEEPYGLFGWFVDPDGNKVELWSPRPVEDD